MFSGLRILTWAEMLTMDPTRRVSLSVDVVWVLVVARVGLYLIRMATPLTCLAWASLTRKRGVRFPYPRTRLLTRAGKMPMLCRTTTLLSWVVTPLTWCTECVAFGSRCARLWA